MASKNSQQLKQSAAQRHHPLASLLGKLKGGPAGGFNGGNTSFSKDFMTTFHDREPRTFHDTEPRDFYPKQFYQTGQWLALLPHSKQVLGLIARLGAFLCGVYMFSPHGFHPASSHGPKTCKIQEVNCWLLSESLEMWTLVCVIVRF